MKRLFFLLFTVATLTTHAQDWSELPLQSNLPTRGEMIFKDGKTYKRVSLATLQRLFGRSGGTSSGPGYTIPELRTQLGIEELEQTVAGKQDYDPDVVPYTSAKDQALTETALRPYIDVPLDHNISLYKRLGSDVKAMPHGLTWAATNTSGGLTSGQIVLHVLEEVLDTMVATGCEFNVSTAGVFTSSAGNLVGLYRLSDYATGTLTLVAQSAENPNMYTSATRMAVPFSSQVTMTPGVYYTALLYNTSAQTTAPAISAASGVGHNSVMGFKNGLKLIATLSGQTALPTTITMSSTSNSQVRRCVAVY